MKACICYKKVEESHLAADSNIMTCVTQDLLVSPKVQAYMLDFAYLHRLPYMQGH